MYRMGERAVAELVPGFQGETCKFEWRPYDQRTPDEQADWRALRDSIQRHGVVNPLIVWDRHVLIGMRRWEIAAQIGISTVPVCEILEYPGQWHISDVRRLRKLLLGSGVWARWVDEGR